MSTVAAAPVSPRRGVASLVGVLAVAAAVAVGQLVAAVVSPMSAPLVAVADAVVRLAPPWLVELGKSLGPETDKLVLQVGVALAVVVLGALAGLLARPDVRRGVAVIAVLGLVGGLAVLALYTLVFIYGFAIALRSRNHFGRLLGLGITINFFLYVFINSAMVMGLIPVVGVPLPLVSYGGTAMMTVMFGFGLMMSAWIHRDVRIGLRGESPDDG
jgi:hypothetical protein